MVTLQIFEVNIDKIGPYVVSSYQEENKFLMLIITMCNILKIQTIKKLYLTRT
jgi:hypothetical protein